jgi:hypothetical protein
MKVKLAYPDYIVEITEKEVFLFNGRLISAPLDEIVEYATGKEAVLPEELKKIAIDIFTILSELGFEDVLSRYYILDETSRSALA